MYTQGVFSHTGDLPTVFDLTIKGLFCRAVNMIVSFFFPVVHVGGGGWGGRVFINGRGF